MLVFLSAVHIRAGLVEAHLHFDERADVDVFFLAVVDDAVDDGADLFYGRIKSVGQFFQPFISCQGEYGQGVGCGFGFPLAAFIP